MARKINYPSVTTKRISVNSFASGMKGNKRQKQTDISRAKLVYNFNLSDGVLKKGIGVSEDDRYDASSIAVVKAKGVYPYIRYNVDTSSYDEKVLIYCSNKYVYCVDFSGGTYKKINGFVFSSVPNVISYNYLDKDVLLLSTEKEGLFMLDDFTVTKIEGAPAFNSLCVHKERVFATSTGEGKSLWFSDDFDPTNWAISLDEAGFIEFADGYGKLLKVVSFMDFVYVFREYGISRVIADGEQEGFSVDTIYGKYGKIFGTSVTECGDFIVMITSNGFYSFNGLSATKIMDEYDSILQGVDNEGAKGVYDGRKLYFKVNVNIDGEVESALVTFDTRDKSSQLNRGLIINDLAYFGGSAGVTLCSYNTSKKVGVIDESGKYLSTILSKEWCTEFCDFGIISKIKNLKKVTLYSLEDAVLTVETKFESKTFNLVGGGVNEFYPCLKGESFKFSITSTSENPEISALTAYVDYIREV